VSETTSELRADILITADQVITHDGDILEKPLNRDEAISFLRSYSSRQCSTVGSIVITNLLTGKRVQVDMIEPFLSA
jgi:predicted house-cleaning NTP pyrophosphatase (Maf/HAM1 superfamily)